MLHQPRLLLAAHRYRPGVSRISSRFSANIESALTVVVVPIAQFHDPPDLSPKRASEFLSFASKVRKSFTSAIASSGCSRQVKCPDLNFLVAEFISPKKCALSVL